MDTHPKLHLSYFQNEPAVDFTKEGEIDNFRRGIALVRSKLGKQYPLFIHGKEISSPQTFKSCNPNKPSEVIGHVHIAEKYHAGDALASAREALPAWSRTAVEDRAGCLLKAAEVIRSRMYEFAAWQILEVGKQWDQAYADVAEAIDFLEYYGREILRIGHRVHLLSMAGEENLYSHEPRGVALVIAPWNFPWRLVWGWFLRRWLLGIRLFISLRSYLLLLDIY